MCLDYCNVSFFSGSSQTKTLETYTSFENEIKVALYICVIKTLNTLNPLEPKVISFTTSTESVSS
jgi:hypothetical protein